MKITEVRIFPKEGHDSKLRAFATITFDDCFVVRDLKVIEGDKGYFVAMPSRRLQSKDGFDGGEGGHRDEFKDIAHPVTSEFREVIQKTVLDAYHSKVQS